MIRVIKAQRPKGAKDYFNNFYIYIEAEINVNINFSMPRKGKEPRFPLFESIMQRFILRLFRWAVPSSSARRAKGKFSYFLRFRPLDATQNLGLSK